MTDKKPFDPSIATRLEFVKTALEIYRLRGHHSTFEKGMQDSTAEAEKLFIKAGLSFPTFVVAKEIDYEIQGQPPRGAWVLIREMWVDTSDRYEDGEWVAAPTWAEATRQALVTSRKSLKGKLGPSGTPLIAFNVRPMYKPTSKTPTYAVKRLYVRDENQLWRWA